MWGVSTSLTEEQKTKLNELKVKYDSFDLQIGTNKDQSVLTDCIVLLKHDTDISEIKNLKSVQWTVICSGGVTEPKINESNRTAGIPPTILFENLGEFLSATKSKVLIAKQDIEILFAIDPKAEANDQPFKDSNPCLNELTLADAKKIAQDYVNCKMTGKV